MQAGCAGYLALGRGHSGNRENDPKKQVALVCSCDVVLNYRKHLRATLGIRETANMTPMDPRTDREILTKETYVTDEHLAIRYQTHERYSFPKADFHQWVLDSIRWRGNEWVLDVGAGPGNYAEIVRQRIPDGRLVVGDLSFGMARQAALEAGGEVLSFDAQGLPFPDGVFDVVLANHMLYHVPDIDQALAEMRRVLRPDGCIVAATNSAIHHLTEFDTLARRACTLLGYPKQKFKMPHSAFSLENGASMLAHYFRAVARYDHPGSFRFTEIDPVLAYIDSTRTLHVFELPVEVEWDEFMDVMRKQVTRLIRAFGELQVQKLAGVLIATNAGGFAADYLELFDHIGVG
jgi:SAM-dependent methyltransferase